jgi:hypothetical protein
VYRQGCPRVVRAASMLTIRDDQLQVFSAEANRRFIAMATDCARRHWPRRAEALGRVRLDARIRAVLVFARRWGLEEPGEVLRVVNAAMALDDDFSPVPRQPWVGQILGDPTLRPADRVERLGERVLEHLRGVVPP